MTYLPLELPWPDPPLEARPYWDACDRMELVFQACAACGAPRHPPGPLCPHCRSAEENWIPAPEQGRIYTWTWVHHPSHEAVRESLPYNIVLVTFAGIAGVRLVSNVIDAGAHDLAVGRRVRLVWQARPGGGYLPRFRLA